MNGAQHAEALRVVARAEAGRDGDISSSSVAWPRGGPIADAWLMTWKLA